ncbi:basic helix-loop-helix family member taiman isoform X5 [Rhodnius prolixus]|uniref:basic helix-loop-helix family member taiman isoform X5 n=1 Tax=Rhodnius prolixus TaxID=13249 RepID=UPI003D18B813
MSTAVADNPGVVRCEVQGDPLWAKMSSTSAPNNKKKKKSDPKPQSQLNKCLNEKRRREQENIYIEELAELISASFADMSSLSVKPDKCAILQETVNQIRHIKEQEAAAASDAVQLGEVSSSKPTILANDVFGPLLLEALEGFLFVVNTEGKVEFVTENVTQFIKYNKDEVLGKSIYNILHHGDHARFSACLLPMWSALEGGGGGSNSTVATTGLGPSAPPRNRTFNCRFLVKPPDDNEQTTMEEKQQRVSKYENMQISSTQLPHNSGSDKDDESGEVGPCLMCVARRIPANEKHLGTAVEQFTTKLDTQGKIVGIDTSGISAAYLQHLSKELVSRPLEELCHPHDVSKLSSHLKEVLTHGQNNSPVYYRLRIGPTHDKYFHVHTKSKLFKSTNSHEHDFIMATHSIIGEHELALTGTEASSSATSLGSHSASSNSSVGGPLMASVNGSNTRGMTTNELTPMSLSNSASSFNALNSTDLDFGFDILTSTTWELAGEERVTWERPESRASLTPAPSPLYSAPPQPSPALASTAFPFSPPLSHPGAGDTDEKESDEPGSESGRLRNLLLTKRPSTDSEESSQSSRNKHRILKGLLNQEEEDQHEHKPAGNNMLLKLLNEKSDDDDVEARAGLKKQHELLQQLLKDDESNNETGGGGVVVVSGGNDDPLLKSLGFRSGTSSPAESVGRGGRKRPSSEEAGGSQDESNVAPLPAKRASVSLLDTLPPSTSVSSSGNSKLCEKNRMLASLLAQRPSTPATIPPVPASIISATPQDKLPRLAVRPGWSGGSVQQQQSQPVRPLQRSPAPQQQQQQQRVSVQYTTNRQQPVWDNQSSDPVLSDLLDQVIEIVPDAITDSPALMNMINSAESPSSVGQSGQFHQDLKEKMAIDAIQESLMLCETAVKNPTFNAQMSSQAQPSGGQQFQPPHIYQQQRQRLPAQLRQTQYNLATQQQQQHQQLLRNKMLQQQQQQQKQRLLQLQQHQQLLIPSNATAGDAGGLHNIDSLMNNSVAPNVALQRSASVPDSQLSPAGSYPGSSGAGTGSANASSGQTPNAPSMITTANPAQISPGQRQPYSPQPFSPVNSGGMNSFQSSGGGQQGGATQQPSPAQQARLSPTSLQSFQQAQLSPRLSQGQQGYGSGQSQSTSWSQQQAARLSLQQQQNPMLNAQLTGGNYSTAASSVRFTSTTPPAGSGGGGNGSGGSATNRLGGGQLPPVRSLTSPGSRQSPFPPELSPTTAASYQFRLQRTISAPPPQATTHLPGSTGRVYGGKEVAAPLVSPSPYHHPAPHQLHHHHHHHHQTQQQQQQQLLYDHHQPPPPQQQYCYEGYHHPHPGRHQAGGGGGGNNGVVTEYVRQELRAIVGARTGGASGRSSGGSGGSGSTTPAHVGLSPHHQVPPVDLDSLTMAFDIQPQGVAESPKMWSTIGEMGNASPQSASALPSRSPMEEVNRSNDQKSSLLQKLLSE